MTGIVLPPREGDRPVVTEFAPRVQLTQNAPKAMHEQLLQMDQHYKV